jgi:hypothetical protein
MARSRVGLSVLASPIVALLVGSALISAQVERPGSAATIPRTVEWRFSEPQPDWKVALPPPGLETAGLERTADALRVTLSANRSSTEPPRNTTLLGGVYVDLPDWRREEWAEVVVRVRSTDGGMSFMSLGLNPREGVAPGGAMQRTFQANGGETPLVRDGLVHTYRIHTDWGAQRTGPWRRIGLWFQSARVQAPASASLDILSVSVVPAAIARPQGRVIETMLDLPRLRSDFALFRLALEEAHPALYRFTTKPAMDAEFARAEARLTQPMTVLQFHNVLRPVLVATTSSIGIGGLRRYRGDEISALIDSSKLFPLALTFESERAFVVLNRGRDERVKPGMEVLAINGQSLADTLRRILPNVGQAGDVRPRQMYELGVSDFVRPWLRSALFGEAYRLYIGDPSRFRTTLRDPQTGRTVDVDLPGVMNAEVAVNVEQNPVNRDVLAGIRTLRAPGPRQSIRYLDGEDAAVLVPAFGGNFPDFLEETFAGLKSKGTKNLIIDLRANTGGTDFYPGLLFSYLTSKEFRQSERTYVKTYAPSFRRYTLLGEVDPVTDSYWGSAAGLWRPDPNGGWLMTEKYPTIGVQKPSENHFDGSVYVLIDGGTISAGSVFCAMVDFHKRATFIGEETGGAAQGGTGSGDSGPTLPASHLHVGIGMESYFTVVDPNNRRRGTLPKYEVRQALDDVAKGRDTVLEFTRELIRTGKGR